MRGFCGWFSNRDDADAQGNLQGMLAASRAPVGNAVSQASSRTALAVFGAAARPQLIEQDGLHLMIAGHARLCGSDGRRNADPRAIALALRARGKAALNEIVGDFALAAWDGTRQCGLLALDRTGVHHIVYARTAQSLVFASSLDMLAGFPGVRRELSAQALYDYLYYHVVPGTQTIYKELHRVPPGHCIEFDDRADCEPRAYWAMRFTEQREPGFEARKREFVELLLSSVAEAAEGENCGAFLSGGTDSSTVSGMLGRVSGQPARSFSIGFDAPSFDETEYARIAARHFGCEQHEYYVTPKDVVDALPRIAASYDQPFGNASAIPTYYCARFAREHGIGRLLAGDGGDELFGGNERYAKQYLLGLYHHLPAGLRRSVVEPLLGSSGTMAKLPPLRKLGSYVEQARPPMPQRYESYNLLQHLGPAEVLSADFLAAVDSGHPRQLMAEVHAPFAADSLINQMLGIDLRFTLTDGDLPKVSHMCNLAGVDVAFPLLDDRLIDFSSRLPSDMKLRGTQLRWFFKQALSDFLPPQIIRKKKHGFGLPVGHWLLEHKPLYELAAHSIDRLRPHGIVRPQFVDHLLGAKLREHPGYYGTMVWVLMMLGLWLDSRRL